MKITIVIESEEDLIQARAMLDRMTFKKKDESDPIEILDLTVRSFNCLKAEGIRTMSQLVETTRRELLCTPNIGGKSVNEIYEAVKEAGFDWPRYHER